MSVPRIQDAAALLEQGNPAAAIPLLEKLAGQFPTYVTAHVLLAEAYEAEGDMDRALRAWHTAYFLLPESPVVRKQRQRAMSALSRGDGARARPAPPAKRPAAAKALPPLPAPPAAKAPPPQPVPPRAEPTPPPKAPVRPAAAPRVEPPRVEPPRVEPPRVEPPQPPTLQPPRPRPPASKPSPGDEIGWQPLGKNRVPLDDLDDALETDAPPSDDLAPVRLGRSTPPKPTLPPPSSAPMDDVDDLDDLIFRLENAGRIVPQTDFEPETPVDLDADDAEDMVSETLAKIYEAQRQFSEAAATYERLARQHPEHSATYLSKAATLRARQADA